MGRTKQGRILIHVEDVHKVFNSGDSEFHALDGVSLTIREGEFVAIIGQSGSGKSTLMNILGCLDKPTSGRYVVAGRDVADLDRDGLAALRLATFGFVFQRYNLLATATAAENVEIPAIYAGAAHEERSVKAQKMLASLGIADRAGHRPGQLSGGQQQRVSIARALMNDPLVILADEPTGALDSASGAEVLTLLEKLHSEGRTVILITHDRSIASRAERIVEIKDGKIVADSQGGSNDQGEEADAGVFELPAVRMNFLADFSEAVKMAFRSLRANLFRTSLTLLGIVIGVAAVVAMLAIGDGSKKDVMDRIQSMGTNLLLIRPGAPGIRPSGEIATMVPADADAIALLANISAVVPERSSSATIRYAAIDYRTEVKGVWPGLPVARDWDVKDGVFFSDDDVKNYAPVVVLGQTVATNLFPSGQSPVGKYVLLKNVPFEVIGVMASKGAAAVGPDQDDVALVPLSTGLMRMFGKAYVNEITVRVDDVTMINDTQENMRQLLISRHGSEDFRIRNTASILEAAEATQNTLTILLGSVALISLLVGGIGVMNIMLVNVTERTREIGIRMATGARMQNILLQFNTEAVVVCSIGGVLGVLFGMASAATAHAFGVTVVYNVMPSAAAFGCAFVTGLVFGFLPARKAARLDPVVALSSE